MRESVWVSPDGEALTNAGSSAASSRRGDHARIDGRRGDNNRTRADRLDAEPSPSSPAAAGPRLFPAEIAEPPPGRAIVQPARGR